MALYVVTVLDHTPRGEDTFEDVVTEEVIEADRCLVGDHGSLVLEKEIQNRPILMDQTFYLVKLYARGEWVNVTRQ